MGMLRRPLHRKLGSSIVACSTLLALVCLTTAKAQEPPATSGSSAFVPLRAGGSESPALRAVIDEGFAVVTAAEALKEVARLTRLNLTFDPALGGLDRRVSIPRHKRSAAEALLEIARSAGVRVDVSYAGDLVVVADTAPVSPSAPPGFARDTVSLPAVRTEASRVERQLFDRAPNVGHLAIAGRTLREAPRFFAEADLLRSIQLMPGTEARNDYYAGFNVRGGEADQNLILLDGYPIYNPFHLGGLFGTFIDPAVGRVDLLTGGFPSPYGGRLSSVLDVRTAEDARRGIHGTAEASLIASSASLSGAMNDGKGTWMIAARRTYLDKAVQLYPGDYQLPYHFRDAQAHVARDLWGGTRLSVTAYDGLDRLATRVDGSRYGSWWGNSILGTTLSKTFVDRPRLLGILLGDSATLEQRLSSSRFTLDVSLAGGAYTLNSFVNDARAVGSLTTFSERHTRQLGYEMSSERVRYATSQPLPLIPVDSSGQRTLASSLFYDDVWRIGPSLIVDAGARLETIGSARWTALLPRLSAKYFVNDNLAVTAAAGEYSQWMRSLAREDVPIRPLDFWMGSDSLAPVSRAWHYVLGMERWVTPARVLRVEGFVKSYRGLLEVNPFDEPTIRGDEYLAASGRSFGVDVMLRQFQTGSHFSGWLSYTFALSSRRGPNGLTFPPAQDRRHDLNLVGDWRFKRYALGARVNVATGTPYTSILGEFRHRIYDATTHSYTGVDDATVYLVGDRNGERLPLTQRIDLSVTRNGRIGSVEVRPYLSIMNVLSSRNVFAYSFDFARHPPEKVGFPQVPILPTFGLSIAW